MVHPGQVLSSSLVASWERRQEVLALLLLQQQQQTFCDEAFALCERCSSQTRSHRPPPAQVMTSLYAGPYRVVTAGDDVAGYGDSCQSLRFSRI